VSGDLSALFRPRSVAVAGASPDPRKQGHTYLRLLLDHGFAGPIYPINPEGEPVLGLRAYRSLLEVPGPVDYVISAVPASGALDLMRQAVQKGVKAVHFFTARFSETGREEGVRLERAILETARRGGVRILGPNCMGLYVPAVGLAFKHGMPREAGDVAFISQSGGHSLELVYDGALRGLRFSKVISYGNALDLNEADFLDYLAEDPETRVVLVYIEGVRSGRRFLPALRRCALRKPVALLKGGRTRAGARAVATHTASLAGETALWQALCRQAGAVWVEDLEELADMAVAFSRLPPARGTRVAVGGGGGGRSVASADDCEAEGLEVPPFPDDLRPLLAQRSDLIAGWVTNPVDGSILPGTGWSVPEVLGLLARHPGYDLVIANLGEAWFLETPEGRPEAERMLEGFGALAREVERPVAVVLGTLAPLHPWQEEALRDLQERANRLGLATFPSLRRCARALRRFAWYWGERWARQGEASAPAGAP